MTKTDAAKHALRCEDITDGFRIVIRGDRPTEDGGSYLGSLYRRDTWENYLWQAWAPCKRWYDFSGFSNPEAPVVTRHARPLTAADLEAIGGMTVAENLGIDLIVRGDGLLAFADGNDAARLLDAGTFGDNVPAGAITDRDAVREMCSKHAADPEAHPLPVDAVVL